MKRSISFRPTLLALVLATNFPVAHAAVPKDMLVIGKAADPQTLDPAVTIDNNDWTVTYPSYQRLVQYKTDGDKGSTDVEGDLASSWKASDDQKEWTFTLKDNAKFADGTPVTAEAVKLSFERLLKIGQGPAEAFPKDLKIDAPDEHTECVDPIDYRIGFGAGRFVVWRSAHRNRFCLARNGCMGSNINTGARLPGSDGLCRRGFICLCAGQPGGGFALFVD